MIKRVKQFQPDVEINSASFRAFAEKSESEILRGISTLTALRIIEQTGTTGIYGYKILKEIDKTTKNMLVIEEGTLYPLLKKLVKEGLIDTVNKTSDQGRKRIYYFITDAGKRVNNHLSGFFSKLIESLSELFEIGVQLPEKYYFCPNCANKIDTREKHSQYCGICGFNLEGLILQSKNQKKQEER
jgi:PadR family transcriptional regulator, regulatory protein PadR